MPSADHAAAVDRLPQATRRRRCLAGERRRCQRLGSNSKREQPASARRLVGGDAAGAGAAARPSRSRRLPCRAATGAARAPPSGSTAASSASPRQATATMANGQAAVRRRGAERRQLRQRRRRLDRAEHRDGEADQHQHRDRAALGGAEPAGVPPLVDDGRGREDADDERAADDQQDRRAGHDHHQRQQGQQQDAAGSECDRRDAPQWPRGQQRLRVRAGQSTCHREMIAFPSPRPATACCLGALPRCRRPTTRR